MRTKTLTLALTLALLSSLALAGEPGRRPDGPGHPGDRPPRELREPGRPSRDDRGPRNRDGRPGPRHGGPGFGPMAGCFGPGPMMGGHGGRFGGPGHGFGPLFMDELNLSADQIDKIIDVMADSFRDGLKLRVEMRDAMKKARELRRGGNASADDIIAVNRDLGELRGKMEALHAGSRAKVEAVLTPEQIEKVKEFRPRPPRPDRFGPEGPRHPRGDRFGPGGWRHGGPNQRWDDEQMDDELDDALGIDVDDE